MNLFGKILVQLYPWTALNKRANKLLSSKPSGFHPGRKCVYRRECKELLESYQNRLETRRTGRILGNKNVSPWTKRTMEQLKEVAK